MHEGGYRPRVTVTRVVIRTGTRRVPRVVRTGTDRVMVRVVVRRMAIYFLLFGAAWERALPAAVLDVLPVLFERRTLLAARAARGVVRLEAMGFSL
jgi:hypothetical protein